MDPLTAPRASPPSALLLMWRFYGSAHNEMLIREALTGINREDYVLSVKFGALRDPSGGWVGIGTSAAHIKYLAQSLQRLGTSYIDIYRPARLDQKVPIEDTIGTMAELVKAGYIRHIGLSEVSAETPRRRMLCIRSAIFRSNIP
jgi:aryl-alcohol dehydrogenase-like predicted oxidoreductase